MLSCGSSRPANLTGFFINICSFDSEDDSTVEGSDVAASHQDTFVSVSVSSAVHHIQNVVSTSEDHDTDPSCDSFPLCTVDNHPPPEQPLDHVTLHRGAQPCAGVGPKHKVK